MWTVPEDYENLNEYLKDHDKIVKGLVDEGKWSFIKKKQEIKNIFFSDGGNIFVMRKAQE